MVRQRDSGFAQIRGTGYPCRNFGTSYSGGSAMTWKAVLYDDPGIATVLKNPDREIVSTIDGRVGLREFVGPDPVLSAGLAGRTAPRAQMGARSFRQGGGRAAGDSSVLCGFTACEAGGDGRFFRNTGIGRQDLLDRVRKRGQLSGHARCGGRITRQWNHPVSCGYADAFPQSARAAVFRVDQAVA